MKNKANWIWYSDDHEMNLYNKCMGRRYERGVQITPFWKMDSHYVTVKFRRIFELTKTNVIRIKADGTFNIFIDKIGYIYDFNGTLTLPAGKYEMQILVNNMAETPCIFVESEELVSDERFEATCQDNEWIPASTGNFYDCNVSPNRFALPTVAVKPVVQREVGKGILYDFGREMMAFLCFGNVQYPQRIYCYYGESEEEALDEAHAEQRDILDVGGSSAATEIGKAFRYVYVIAEKPYGDLTVSEEKTIGENRSVFTCNDKLLEKIFDVSVYTLGLCKREFFLDGIKRDRWVWSGDAYQSYLLDYYSFWDTEVIKRTMRVLKGKLPIKTHINHIMDYTMYWLLGLYDYYFYTGDRQFLGEMYVWAEQYLQFLLSRTNEEGFLFYHPDDWVFIDWADIDNRGETSFEQILLYQSLMKFAELSEVMGKDGTEYVQKAQTLKKKIFEVFWTENGFVHGRLDGVVNEKITKYSNMFVILFDMVNETQKECIVEKVLLNSDVQPINTPYMRFYELMAIAKIGRCQKVLDEIKSYWGGMLAEGATTFWEKYNADEKGENKYAMYGRKYGKSLCHAWGASPIYLIGRFIMGIRPAAVGYDTFLCEPYVDMSEAFYYRCPVKEGFVTLEKKDGKLFVSANGCCGIVKVAGKEYEAMDGRSLIIAL